MLSYSSDVYLYGTYDVGLAASSGFVGESYYAGTYTAFAYFGSYGYKSEVFYKRIPRLYTPLS